MMKFLLPQLKQFKKFMSQGDRYVRSRYRKFSLPIDWTDLNMAEQYNKAVEVESNNQLNSAMRVLGPITVVHTGQIVLGILMLVIVIFIALLLSDYETSIELPEIAGVVHLKACAEFQTR